MITRKVSVTRDAIKHTLQKSRVAIDSAPSAAIASDIASQYADRVRALIQSASAAADHDNQDDRAAIDTMSIALKQIENFEQRDHMRVTVRELRQIVSEAVRGKKQQKSKLALSAQNYPKSWSEYRKYVASLATELGLSPDVISVISDLDYGGSDDVTGPLWDAWQECEIEATRKYRDDEGREDGASAVAGTIHDLFIDLGRLSGKNAASVAERADAAACGFGVPEYEKSKREIADPMGMAELIATELRKLRVTPVISQLHKTAMVDVKRSKKSGEEMRDAVFAAVRAAGFDVKNDDGMIEVPLDSSGSEVLEISYDWADPKDSRVKVPPSILAVDFDVSISVRDDRFARRRGY